MTNLQNPPTTAKPFAFDCLQAMDIILKLEAALAGKEDAISRGIKLCINDGTPAMKIIREINEMARDNYNAMADLVGSTLLLSITNFNSHV